MFPTYAIRVFGADFPVASIFGTLNPVMIIFLGATHICIDDKRSVLHNAALGNGTFLQHLYFLCFIPESVSMAIADTWFGTWVFDYWLCAHRQPRSIYHFIGHLYNGVHGW